MSQLHHRRFANGHYPLTVTFITPRMVSSGPTRFHCPPTYRYSPWSSEFARAYSTKGSRDMLKRDRAMQVAKHQKGPYTRYWSSFKGFFRSNSRKAKKLDSLAFPFVPYDRWRAHGYFPRPASNRVQVCNPTPRRIPSITRQPDAVWNSLRSLSNSQSSANWLAGRLQQPVLQPPVHEPSPWVMIPPAPDIRLDPYLQHRCSSPHPISFDIMLGPSRITHHKHGSPATPLDPAFLARPATYPPVKHMRIETVADDPLPHFPWPIEVKNARGITCGDVFQAISRHFLEYVTEDEYNSWTTKRKKMASRAYYARVRSHPPGLPGESTPPGDGLRRIDYVGERVLFRGLEQASAMMGGTWLMYLGGQNKNMSCFGANSIV